MEANISIDYKKSPIPYLKQGDRVILLAPSGAIDHACLERGIKLLETWGLNIDIASHVLLREGVFAGSDAMRASDMQKALDDTDIRAIFCLRGGYGSARIIDLLNFDKFKVSPKWIIGFSDITAFHSLIHGFKLPSIHSCMPQSYPQDPNNIALVSLYKALFGCGLDYKLPAHVLNRYGDAKGEIIGGNLSVLYSLRACPEDLKTQGKILFIEDLNEYDYHIDRMMLNLKRGGFLEGLAALIVGAFSGIKTGKFAMGMDAEKIIYHHVQDYHYPLYFGFCAGHIENNQALIFGLNANIK